MDEWEIEFWLLLELTKLKYILVALIDAEISYNSTYKLLLEFHYLLLMKPESSI